MPSRPEGRFGGINIHADDHPRMGAVICNLLLVAGGVVIGVVVAYFIFGWVMMKAFMR